MIHLHTTAGEGVFLYNLFYLASILAGIILAAHAAQKTRIPFRDFAVALSTILLSVLVMGKLFAFDATDWNLLFSNGHLAADSGKSVLGVLAGGLAGSWVARRITGSKASILGLFAFALPIGMAIQRLGCLCIGCCHGTTTSLPWGITYGPGSKVYRLHEQLGMIPYDADASLPVHPNQFYIVMACLVITWTVWKARSRWNSPSSGTLLAVVLYLAVRFFEEFVRYHTASTGWLGITGIQWKIAALFSLAILLLYLNERRSVLPALINRDLNPGKDYHRIFFFTVLLIFASLESRTWFSNDEYAVLIFAVLPLAGLGLLDILYREFYSKNLLKYAALFFLSFLLMSQKKPEDPVMGESYTALNLSYLSGKFDRMEEINCHTATGCDGSTYNVCDATQVEHTYNVGGFGVERKKVYNKWQNTTTSLNVFIGRENSSSQNSSYRHTLVGISPRAQYDGRGFGAGMGLSFGSLGFDNSGDFNPKPDFDPNLTERNVAFQLRLRFFSERYLFLESLNGYESGAMGHYTSQILVGTRFNTSDKYMLKAGMQFDADDQHSFVLVGQFPIADHFYLYPELAVWDNADVNRPATAYRTSLKIQYRLGSK